MSDNVRMIGMDELKQQLQRVNDFLASTEPMAAAVEDVKTEILTKTANGMDWQNKAFAPYSEAYAKKKVGMAATGRPNMKMSGTMIGAIQARVISPTYGQVYVENVGEPGGHIDADLLANIHTTGTGRQPQRNFMAINDTRMAAIKKERWDDPLLEIAKLLR